MAFVVLHPQHESKWKGRLRQFEIDLKQHAKARLPGFACPEWVEVVPELPVSRICPLTIAHSLNSSLFTTENINGKDTEG